MAEGFPLSQHARQALSPTHPQALQVTTEARALHVNEGLGEKHKGDVRAPGGTGAHPGAAGITLHLCGLMDPHPSNPCVPGGTHQLVILGGGSRWSRRARWSRGSPWPHAWVTLAQRRG